MATANMKDIKRRIKSVESTMQITKAMELVASSKLRKAKARFEASQPFFNSLYETMCDISSDSVFSSVFSGKRELKNSLLIVIAGDRGLAGGFNSNVLKSAAARSAELMKDGSVKIIAVGKKAVEYFEKRNYDVLSGYQHISESLSIEDAMDISEEIILLYKSGEIDRVELFYTTFVSALDQQAQRMIILPVEIENETEAVRSQTIYDPSPSSVFDGLIPKYVAGILYGAIVDSFASEQAARRTAMESASDNAEEMISSLSLIYNRARQAAITQEISEIVGGANSNNQ